MDDTSILAFLGGLQRMGINPGLENISAVLRALGNPQLRFNSVIIGGTNGKGSTAAFLASILRAAGYKTALYTSPHLIHVSERIRINGNEISENDFETIGKDIKVVLEKTGVRLTFFEAVTAIGFEYFARSGIDIAVLEVGMGGRFDATNTVLPLVSVITNVSIDHSQYLGSTVEDIAGEKGGIIHSGGELVSGVNQWLYNSVLKPICEREGVVSVLLGRDFSYSGYDEDWSYRGRRFDLKGIVLPLRGSFQGENAALACAAAESLAERGYLLTRESIVSGLSKTVWRGRFEVIRGNPRFVIDGAHNPGAFIRLTETLVRYGINKVYLVFGCRPDKDYRRMLAIIGPFVESMVITSAQGLLEADEIAKTAKLLGIPHSVEPDLSKAVSNAIENADQNSMVLLTGSLYLVGAFLKIYRQV